MTPVWHFYAEKAKILPSYLGVCFKSDGDVDGANGVGIQLQKGQIRHPHDYGPIS